MTSCLCALLWGCAGADSSQREALVPGGMPVEAGLLDRAPRNDTVVADAVAPTATPVGAVPASPDPGGFETTLQIAESLAREERHRDALAVVDRVLARTADPRLVVARAGLLRDLGQRHLAVQCLRDLVASSGPAALHPGLLFERAELEWLEGRRTAAREAVEELQRVHAGDPWLVENEVVVRAMLRELAANERVSRLRVRDLLGNLRGAPDPTERLRALELAAAAGSEELCAMAVAIAAADDAPLLRAHAVRLADVERGHAAELCRVGLQDEAPVVRGSAAARAVRALGADAVPLLLAALERERDAAAWTSLCDALALLVPGGPPTRGDDCHDAARRDLHLSRWRAAVHDSARRRGQRP